MLVDELEAFPGRREALQSILRYHSYEPMFYRTNLWIHSQRLVWLLQTVGPAVRQHYPSFNLNKACAIAAIHDDPEIITGDVQLGAKLIMSDREKQNLWTKEAAAIQMLTERFPKYMNGFSYGELLSEYQELGKENLEGVVAKYIDKFDAFGEALHELHAGNSVFATGFAADITSPVDVYMDILTHFDSTWPLFQPLRRAHPIFDIPQPVDVPAIVANGQPHTAAGVLQPTGHAHYDWWRRVTIEKGKKQGIHLLTHKQE